MTLLAGQVKMRKSHVEKQEEFIHRAVGLWGDISTESWSPACSQASS